MSTRVLQHTPSFDELLNDGVRKVLFLDFDGVVNPLAGTFEIGQKKYYRPNHLIYCDSPWGGEERYIVKWSTEMIEHLSSLVSTPDSVLIWLTAWKQNVIVPVSKMGFAASREQLWLDFDKGVSKYPKQALKREAMSDFLGDTALPIGVKVAWVDDEVLTGSHSADFTTKFGPGALPVRTNTKYGLSRWDISCMKRFFNSTEGD